MADDKIWVVGVLALLGMGLYFGGVFDTLLSLHPGQPSPTVYGDNLICGSGSNTYPSCWDLGSCFGGDGTPSVALSDGSESWIIYDFGKPKTLNSYYSFDGKCIRLTTSMDMIVSYPSYFKEGEENKVIFKYTSNWKKSQPFYFVAWLTYKDINGDIKTIPPPSYSACNFPNEQGCGWGWPNIWNWQETLNPGVESSHEIALPDLPSGTYQIHIMSAIIFKSTGAYPTPGPLAGYAQSQRPYSNPPEGWGVFAGGQEIGYWERPLMISTKPIYKGECEEGKCDDSDYTCQKSSNLCVRTDILENNLACQTIGCPVNEDKTYLCASNGICTENIQQFTGCTKDSDCSPELTCDLPSGTCVRIEKIECSVSSDCFVPCTAVSISCKNNKCFYEGSCETTTEGFKDCNSEGCDTGYDCNAETGVCYATTVSTTPTGVNSQPANPYETPPPTTPSAPSKPTIKESWWKTEYTYILAGLLTIGGIVLFLNKKGG